MDNLSEAVNSAHLRGIVKEGNGRAVILFSGEWCPDCQGFKPTWSRWQGMTKERTFTVEVPRGGSEWHEWNLDEIPTVAVFSRGRELGRVHGAITADDLEGLIRRASSGL